VKIPGIGLVGSLADGVTGGAAQLVRAGANAAAGAADTLQMLASPVVELVVLVTRSCLEKERCMIVPSRKRFSFH